ncbi:MAG: hypothetical protein K0R17_1696 [Rariglobus sp.]|jgi:hypothetical protein|nr:hypothetical protein [Rariglobus sp.]
MLSRDCTVSSTAAAARAHLRAISPDASPALIDGVSVLVEELFAGRHPGYQKADLKYHNLDHTVLATQCFVDLAKGRVQHDEQPVFSPRQFSLGYAAILLHDSGYLKTRDDVSGTGAKYTSSHVQRSCALAALALPDLGCSADEIEGVQNAIRCTGLNSQIDRINFRSEIERLTGCMVVTADYLGQMADPDYPVKLPRLFEEFEEANNFSRVPFESRPFRSAKDLMAKTTAFWHGFALPKLDRDYQGVYRLLTQPDGSNPYLEAVEANLVRIAELAVE